MIYKEPSIYKYGISKEDIKKMSSGWIECASKLGTKLVSGTSNFQIYINEFLLLVNVRSYVNV